MRIIPNVLVSYQTHTNTHSLLYLHRPFDSLSSTRHRTKASLSLPVCSIFHPPYLSSFGFCPQIYRHTHINTHTHTRARSWEILHYAAGSISVSKTTLICMCEMGSCSPLPTYLRSCREGLCVSLRGSCALWECFLKNAQSPWGVISRTDSIQRILLQGQEL